MPSFDYDTHSRQRWTWEAVGETGPARSPFARDRARILHSAALRRLAAKTQVVTAGEDDFPRTRLTHSLEVAQIGREIATRLGADPDVVDAAGLAHDLGHPPFGHTGEKQLNIIAQSCGGFEGNAQTLRILTRLEPKLTDEHGVSVGLNLSRATLDAVTKYPWSREQSANEKFGVYFEDMPVFVWLRQEAPQKRRCLEAQIMDWADDVAYSVHDLEDGLYAGHIQFRLLDDFEERHQLCQQVMESYSTESLDYLQQVLDELLQQQLIVAVRNYDATHVAQRAAKKLTSTLVGWFAGAAVMATRQRFGDHQLRRYGADLVVPRRVRAQCALLKGLALRYVLGRPGAEQHRSMQRELIATLADKLLAHAPQALDPVFAPLWKQAADDGMRLRVVVDQIAQLTDRSLVTWLRKYQTI